MSNDINPLNQIAMAGQLGARKADSSGTSFFEAMAKAWGEALDGQAAEIQRASDKVTGGDDKPAAITDLSAQSMKMSFMATSSQASISAVGQALNTMARKQ